MSALYRRLLHLYPADYFREFSEEMTSVFCQAQQAAGNQSVRVRALFCVREISGVLTGALRERFGCRDWILLGRFDMRPEYRFPRSTIFLMLMILVGVFVAIEKGRNIAAKYSADAGVASVWSTLYRFLGSWFALVFVAGVLGYAILFALRRSGVHRLSRVQIPPEQR